MKPLEAAQIIETMPDNYASKLLNAMSDDRQKAKILSALSTEKAARVTERLGQSR
jgi:flagellar motility protein MotE (MotC chaperone)